MKIAYCIDSVTALGGIERITLSKANALADILGNEVYIIVAFHRGDPVSTINPKVHLVNLKVDYYADYGMSRLQAFLFMRKKRKEHIRKLQAFLNEIQPDILISTNQSEKHFIRTLSLDYKPVIIREFHFCSDYRVIEAQSCLQKIIARIGTFMDCKVNIHKVDRIVLLTEEDRNRNWRGCNRVAVIPNPVTMVSAYPPSSVEKKRVIAAGRLVRQKNFESLLRSWKRVVKQHPDWVLEIYGEGMLKGQLENQIDKMNLGKSVYLKGRTNDIFSKMTSSSIYALSSIYEGFALVLIEAMSCGLPVVSYDCPCGPKDLIEDGENGFLVPLNDEKTLADRMCRLIEDDKLRKKMGASALVKSKCYQMDNIMKQWMDLFDELIAAKK